jgi:hypothetical protein
MQLMRVGDFPRLVIYFVNICVHINEGILITEHTYIWKYVSLIQYLM